MNTPVNKTMNMHQYASQLTPGNTPAGTAVADAAGRWTAGVESVDCSLWVACR